MLILNSVMRYNKLTQQEMDIVKDPVITLHEAAEKIGVNHITISRWRKKLGVKGIYRRKGVEVPAARTGYTKTCLMEGCENTFRTIPSQDQKYCSRSCRSRHLMLTKNPAKGEKERPWRRKPDRPAYKQYQGQVQKLTEEVYNSNIDEINPMRYHRTLCGVEGGWQLDHIESIRYCFDNGLSAEYCSRLENLQMLPWADNLKKGK